MIAIRFATAADCGLILHFIRELALFEKAPGAVVATEADLLRHGFGPDPRFETLIAERDGEPVGMALFHTRFSTWLGQPTPHAHILDGTSVEWNTLQAWVAGGATLDPL